MYKFIISFSLTLFSLVLNAQSKNDELLSLLQSFCKTSAVTGREEEASQFIQSLFKAGTFKKDKLGNLVLTIGNGYPRRLFAAPLDEPGYVISAIQENGYLRITPVGYGQRGNMYHQFLQGNEIKINTGKGSAFGVAVVPSAHFEGLRVTSEESKPVYQWQETFIDIGVNSATEVSEKGIQLLDPVTLNKKPQIVSKELISAPSAKSKSAVVALAIVAKTLMETKFTGTVVIAFTTLELLNGKGLEAVVNKNGPFDQVIRFNRFLTSEIKENPAILVDKKLVATSINQTVINPILPFRHVVTLKPDWDTAKVYGIGLPSNNSLTPVEMVHINAIEQLIKTWLRSVEDKEWTTATITKPTNSVSTTTFKTFEKENYLTKKLISLYGVSGDEGPVRDFILSQLPSWAKPVTDPKGNIILTFGKGKQHIAFVAHMDEVGYVVDTIRNDGKLKLKQRGGFYNSVWEGHAAIIHAKNKEISALFEPRSNYMTATLRNNDTAPIVFAGFISRQQALEAGILEGSTTVTMPKQMIRLSEDKATARGFDDRVGCAALLLALQNINPEELPFTVTFVWSVEEETGLTGSTFSAKSLQNISVVYPIDTYVSSDDPIEPKTYANCPLGNGAVIRVLESINFVSRENLAYMQALAKINNIKTQYGMTAGGTDGQAFLKYDIPSVPLSWPGRYSHSPIEIMDFRDMNNLVLLIKAIMLDKTKTY
ncbi:MAG: M20/M25/M40 family metallo-hydrolase [Ferruginibacter sp.]|nr:M20/M25/M40 family metallo-hydrolase [Ferruginibacter sp.]